MLGEPVQFADVHLGHHVRVEYPDPATDTIRSVAGVVVERHDVNLRGLGRRYLKLGDIRTGQWVACDVAGVIISRLKETP